MRKILTPKKIIRSHAKRPGHKHVNRHVKRHDEKPYNLPSTSINKRSAGYSGANTDRLSGNWFTGCSDINALIGLDNPRMRARVRDLVRNFPPFARCVKSIITFIIGKGSKFQSLALGADGKPDFKLRKKIEERFLEWSERADVAGKMHLYECEQLAKRQELESGEYICLFTKPRKRDQHFALQFFEGENLTDWRANAQSKNSRIWQGIEYDIYTGEPLAYHFQTSYAWQEIEAWREDAKNVLHGFQTLRPGQLRGVTPFAPAIMLAKDMGDYVDAELDSAKMAAKWLAFVKSPTPDAYQNARSLTPNNGIQREDIDWLENASIEYLKDGEDITIAPGSHRPGDSFDRFIKFVLRMIGITLGVPYEIISGDYTNINYSTSKASRNDFIQFLAPEKFRMEQHFTRPIFHKWLEFEALTQDYMRGYWINPNRFKKCMFIPAGLPSVDPLRDGKADIDAINAGIKSPQMVILGQGHDPEDIVEQRKIWSDINELAGLNPVDNTKISTQVQQAPNQLME